MRGLITAFEPFLHPLDPTPQKSEREPGEANSLGTYGRRVDPTDLCLKLRETDKQYHVEIPRVARLAFLSAVCVMRNGGEIYVYRAQCLKLVCLT